MQKFFVFGRFSCERPKASLLSLAVVLGIVAAGCGKSGDSKSSVAAPPPTPSSDSTATTPAANPQPTQAAAVTKPDDTTGRMQALNRAMVSWMIRNKRRPQTFQEFASTAGFQIPDPPAGKKYAINSRGFIVLVDASN